MILTGRHVGVLHTAILQAYSEDSFRRVIRVEMNIVLSNVIGGDNFSDKVFNFIEWVEQRDRVPEFVVALCAGNPENTMLQLLAKDLPQWLRHAESAELATAQKLVAEHMRLWVDSNQSGRGDAIILPPDFKVVNANRLTFAGESKEVKAFLLRCAVQNGMSGQWGKWLLDNLDNELILRPLIRSFSTVGWHCPAWRAAAILEQLPSECIRAEFATLDATLARQISYSGHDVWYYVDMLTNVVLLTFWRK